MRDASHAGCDGELISLFREEPYLEEAREDFEELRQVRRISGRRRWHHHTFGMSQENARILFGAPDRPRIRVGVSRRIFCPRDLRSCRCFLLYFRRETGKSSSFARRAIHWGCNGAA